jgi:hypothetical protein
MLIGTAARGRAWRLVMKNLRSVCALSMVAFVLALGSCSEKSDDGGASDGTESGSGDGSGTGDGGGDDGGDDGDDDGGTGGTGGGDDGQTDDGDDGGTGSGSDGGAFIAEPDGGVVGQCDPGLQDCPNPDEKCTSYATEPGTCCVDANRCVPIIGDGQAGDDCTRTDENDTCDKGFFCTTQTSAGTGDGYCEEYCVANDPASCESGGTCIPYNDGVHPLCRVECDPLLQDCDVGYGCYAAFDMFVCGKPAHDPGEGQDDGECYTTRSCEPGLACVNADATANCDTGSCCTPFCDLSQGTVDNPTCTEPTEQCVAWFEAGQAPPGYEDVGACTIPQ